MTMFETRHLWANFFSSMCIWEWELDIVVVTVTGYWLGYISKFIFHIPSYYTELTKAPRSNESADSHLQRKHFLQLQPHLYESCSRIKGYIFSMSILISNNTVTWRVKNNWCMYVCLHIYLMCSMHSQYYKDTPVFVYWKPIYLFNAMNPLMKHDIPSSGVVRSAFAIQKKTMVR